MNQDLDKNERVEDVLRNEEDAIQKDMEELKDKRDHLKKIRDLKDKRDVIEEEMDYIKGKKKRISFDQITFFDILLFVILVLLSGVLIVDSKGMKGYAVIPLIVAAIIAWKLIDKFA